jgi:hypothetical protein
MGMTTTGTLSETSMLHKLQGMTRVVIDRLEDENIDSTQKLALADPIRLLLRTNLEWKDIIDYIDQAFLFNYIGDKINDLRPLGIRCTLELIDLWESLGGEDGTLQIVNDPQSPATRTMLHVVSEKLNQELITTRYLIITISSDIHILFIRDLWSQTQDQTQLPPQLHSEPLQPDQNPADELLPEDPQTSHTNTHASNTPLDSSGDRSQ